MKNKTKTFDCVEMKRRGSQRIYETIKDMTIEQEIAYWRERSRRFREELGSLATEFDRHIGSFDSGDPQFSDNERIDADLEKE
jgi:hypothetical protein